MSQRRSVVSKSSQSEEKSKPNLMESNNINGDSKNTTHLQSAFDLKREQHSRDQRIWTAKGLFADIVTGIIFWSLTTRIISIAFFLGLFDIAFSGWEPFLSWGYIAPCLVAIPFIRKSVVHYFWVYRILGLGGILIWHLPSLSPQVPLSGIFTCVEVLATFGNWFYSSKQRRYRGIYGNLIGLVITVIARIANLSLNPLWFFPIANYGICVLGLIASFIYISEETFERKSLTTKHLNDNWMFDGCLYAGIYYLTFALVSAHGTLARYVGIQPFPSGIWVVLVIVFGILISQMNIISSLLWWFVGLVGWVLFMSSVNQFPPMVEFGGGLLLSLYCISIWFKSVDKMADSKHPGKAYFLGGILIFLFHIWSLYTVGYKFFPFGWVLRERSLSLVFTPLLLSMIGHVQTVFPVGGWFSVRNPRFRVPRMVIVTLLLVLVLFLVPTTYYRYDLIQRPTTGGNNPPLIKTGVTAIHFGYDNIGGWSGDNWIATLKQHEVNVLSIVETDGMRTLIDNRDITEWFAEKLNWYSDFGPTSATNTWGCAFLSAYPIENVDRLIMPSPEGELACVNDALIRVNGTLVRVISGHFGNTEDKLDLKLQNEYMVDRLANYHKGVPTIFTAYVTTPPFLDRHVELLQAGLKDSTNSLDRYCLYTLYRDLVMTDFQRVDAEGKSDTELQIGTFRLIEKNDPHIESLTNKTCADAANDVVLCDQLADRCGWCQLETLGHCYQATNANYLGCEAFDGSWHGKVPADARAVNHIATKEQVQEFYKAQVRASRKSTDRIDFVNRTDISSHTGEQYDVDVIWRQNGNLFYEWNTFRTTWSSPIFEYQESYWRLRVDRRGFYFGYVLEYLPGVAYRYSQPWVKTATDVNFILNPHLITAQGRDSLVRSIVSPVWWHRVVTAEQHPMRQGVLNVIGNHQISKHIRNEFVLGLRMN